MVLHLFRLKGTSYSGGTQQAAWLTQRGWLGIMTLLMSLSVGLPVSAQSEGICPAQLAEAIASIVNAPSLHRAHWGILVETLEPNPVTLYAQAADQYFTPASNVKLLITAAALTQLGSQFRIRTSLYQNETEQRVVRVVGRGDPSLTDTELRQLAQQIAQRGIRQIDVLRVDDQYFRGDAINVTWEWEDIQAGYGAAVNSLILNQNAIGLTLIPQALGNPLQVVWDDPAIGQNWQIDNRSRTVAKNAPEFLQVGRDFDRPILRVAGQLQVGSASEPVAISVPQPTAYFAQRFRQILSDVGIQVQQVEVATDALSAQAVEIAGITSPALAELLIETNQHSNNLYAEALLRSLGQTQAPSGGSSLESGLEVLQATLTRLGIAKDGYVLVDGSGLSRHNLISPKALVQTLQSMARSPDASTYRNSLSVAGRSGTLRHRFQDSVVQNHLQGKTGFISGAAALSGYLEPSHYSPLAFSIIVNQFDRPIGEVQQAIDQVVEQLARVQPCP
jgi:serine-type D-Ala-D-Ala carboxypeptidase/endopeptidase (penicillin-binding protein 4)